MAGLRTFGLTGLLGGLSGLLTQSLGALILAVGLAAVSALVIAAYLSNRQHSTNISATTHVAMLTTFLLGALAGLDQVVIAAACAVITTLLLRSKRALHRLLEQLSQSELNAGLQLLIISLVLLPVLPNKGYGPWQALNPYETWWMVVLIAAISFTGYFLIKIMGAKRGILMTGLAGGLLSSTALTLQLSRLAHTHPSLQRLCAVGILTACGVMFVRVVLLAGLINPALIRELYIPMTAMSAVVLSCATLILLKDNNQTPVNPAPSKNPLELAPALLFGLLLAAVALLSQAMREWMGDPGILLLATASGIADVDAINLTLSRMAGRDILIDIATQGIILASVSNTLLKGGLAVFSGGTSIAQQVTLPLFLAAASGVLCLWLF